MHSRHLTMHLIQVKCEDAKEVIRSRKSKKDRQYSGQKKQAIKTNNGRGKNYIEN
jgi:hypothetical protein